LERIDKAVILVEGARRQLEVVMMRLAPLQRYAPSAQVALVATGLGPGLSPAYIDLAIESYADTRVGTARMAVMPMAETTVTWISSGPSARSPATDAT
jgi:hypothetical protein